MWFRSSQQDFNRIYSTNDLNETVAGIQIVGGMSIALTQTESNWFGDIKISNQRINTNRFLKK